MHRSRWWAALAGAVATAVGLGVAELVGGVLHRGTSPVLAVGEAVISIVPGWLAEGTIQLVGTADKPLLVTGTVLAVLLLGALAGVLAVGGLLRGVAVLLLLGVVAVMASVMRGGGSDDLVTLAAAVVVAVLVLVALVRRVPGTGSPAGGEGRGPHAAHDEAPGGAASPQGAPASRRRFLVLVGVGAVGAAGLAVAGRVAGQGRRAVEAARRTLRLPVRRPPSPSGTSVGLAGVAPWQTPNADFYRIDTVLAVPEVDPQEWRLRIHGLVEREIEVGYDELVDLGLTDVWVTLTCVSNEVGGGLVGNAWWSGVPVADLLEQAGVSGDADAVLQTSADGWTCGTPLPALTDGRNALLAVAMNGEPLPLEHGFPVRMVVPGLYGYVSATKWLVDLEVTRFDRISAFWTERGWAERGPIKVQSRIDVPRSGASVEPGRVGVGGVAWAQHTGIERVEVRVDDGSWHEARLGAVPNADTWRQWAWTWEEAAEGAHELTVRATTSDGRTQTGMEQGVVPDGATGWHTVTVEVG